MEFIDTEPNDTVSCEFGNSQDSLVHTVPLSDHDMDDETLGKLLAEVHRDYADYRRPEGVSVMVDRTGKLVEKSDDDHFGFSVRNVKSVQHQFSVITQADRMVDRMGKPLEEMIGIVEERESSKIRTLFENKDEQARRFLITNSKQVVQKNVS